jgi:hypothetical protein
LIGSLGLSLLAGCPDRTIAELPPGQNNVESKRIPLDLNRNLDLLFMVDNSSSTTGKQNQFKAAFPEFINVLESIPGGAPSMHIGVVTSDLGDGDFAGCAAGNGEDGHLQYLPGPGSTAGCTGPTDHYIVDIANPDGTRMTNYDTTQGLANTFACIASVGASGCGFEHQIGSPIRALDPTNSFNNGFLRPDAFLGIVFLTDEDDCTASSTALYDQSNQSLGPLASFRCTRYGVCCDQDTNTDGVKSNCQPCGTGSAQGNQYFANGQLDGFVNTVKALKPDPDHDIVVAGIYAPPTPVEVIPAPSTESDPGSPFLKPSCTASFGNGDPGTRMDYFIKAFQNNSTNSVCDSDYAGALQNIATVIREAIGDPCIQGTLAMPYDCTVTQVSNPGTPQETQKVLNECTPNGAGTHTNTPCWFLQTDASHCATTPTMLELSFDFGGASTSPSDVMDAECVLQ